MKPVRLPSGFPKKLNISGTTYRIQYVEHPTDADVMKRQSNFGQIDGWTNIIRIYVGPERTPEATWRVIFHELIHGIMMEYSIEPIIGLEGEPLEVVTEMLAAALFDTLTRNGLLKVEC